ncbi:Two-component response regulator-like PRR1 [Sesbania bispinosa]|nr:Two-component response regulator-like PRR1 [Sesbania bispinosa]
MSLRRGACLVKAKWGGGLGEGEEEAIVSEGLMEGKGGAKAEEFQSEGRVF